MAKKGMYKKVCDFILKYEILIFILLLVAVLRLPTLVEPNRYADEDIYLTLGQGLNKGLVFYRDIHDNKPPLLYLLAAVAGKVMWFRFILLFWNLVNVVLVWKLAERLVKKTRTVAGVSLLFGILGVIPLLEGNIANAEIFMIMPVTGAVLLLLQAREKLSYWKYFAAGLLFSMAFLFKVPVVFDLFGVMFFLYIYEAKNMKGVLRWFVDLRPWLLVLGFGLPILITIGYYFGVGAGNEYLRAAFGQNFDYVSSWEGGQRPFYESGMVQRLVILASWLLALLLWRKKLGWEFGLAGTWFIAALFGANLSGRPYPHYLVQVIVPLVLLLGVMWERKKVVRMVGMGLVLTLALALWRYQFWFYRSIPYYVNYVQYVSGQKTKEEHDRFFGDGVIRNYKIAEYIRMRTEEDERIYVWGTEPSIYVVAERLPVYKYTVAYHVKDFDGWKGTMEAIKMERPKYIVVMDYEDEFKELSGYVAALYAEALVVDGGTVYRRINNGE